MKLLIAQILLLFSFSCVSTKYDVYENRNDFHKVQAGTKYTIFYKNNRKIFLNVTSMEKDSIRGTRKNQPFAIAKNDIKQVKKNKTGATVAIVGVTSGVFILMYVIADSIKKFTNGFGNTDDQ